MSDPIIKRTIEQAAGLRAGSTSDHPDALAIYSDRAGEDIFIIVRDGLLLLQAARFIANREIHAVSIDAQVKVLATSRRLVLTLVTGERVELSVDGQRGKFLDIFPVHAFLRRRVHQQRGSKAAGPT